MLGMVGSNRRNLLKQNKTKQKTSQCLFREFSFSSLPCLGQGPPQLPCQRLHPYPPPGCSGRGCSPVTRTTLLCTDPDVPMALALALLLQQWRWHVHPHCSRSVCPHLPLKPGRCSRPVGLDCVTKRKQKVPPCKGEQQDSGS